MSSGKIEVQSRLLAEARQKYDIAKYLVIDLKARVGPTSRKLAEAKSERRKAEDEVTRLERVLEDLGLTAEVIAAIVPTEIDVPATVFV